MSLRECADSYQRMAESYATTAASTSAGEELDKSLTAVFGSD